MALRQAVLFCKSSIEMGFSSFLILFYNVWIFFFATDSQIKKDFQKRWIYGFDFEKISDF